MDSIKNIEDGEVNLLEFLFKDKNEYEEFLRRYEKEKINYVDINLIKSNCYLGIDVGLIIIKVVFIDEDGRFVYFYYNSNEGNLLKIIIKVINEVYDILLKNIKILSLIVIGYGEGFIKKVFKIDNGEIEIIVYYKVVKFFNKDVDFIFDIGG